MENRRTNAPDHDHFPKKKKSWFSRLLVSFTNLFKSSARKNANFQRSHVRQTMPARPNPNFQRHTPRQMSAPARQRVRPAQTSRILSPEPAHIKSRSNASISTQRTGRNREDFKKIQLLIILSITYF